MKLNKKMIMLCIWVLSLLMTGCFAENSEKDTHNKETKGNEPQTVKMRLIGTLTRILLMKKGAWCSTIPIILIVQ